MGEVIDINKDRKKKERNRIITWILFICTLIYICYAVYLTIKTPTNTVRVEKGILTSEESATGYIIRDETVVKGDNYKNGIYQILSEKEKAAKNQTIFRYYSKNEDEILEKID